MSSIVAINNFERTLRNVYPIDALNYSPFTLYPEPTVKIIAPLQQSLASIGTGASVSCEEIGLAFRLVAVDIDAKIGLFPVSTNGTDLRL